MEGLEEFITATMAAWEVTGLAVAVVKEGEVIHSGGYGKRDVERDLNVTPDTLFAIGSCTKAFTCTALGILVDEGKLEWDRPVREYVPSFRVHDDYVSDHMTPRDLVTHRSGLPRHDFLWYNGRFSRQELFDRLRYLEPSRGFREHYQYNNLMYMAAGVLVEQVAGVSWEEFVRGRILLPLGMNGCNLSVTDSEQSDDFAQPYAEKDETVQKIPFKNIDAIGPAGSINSGVADMAKWLMLNLNGGKAGDRQIISEEGLKRIHSPQFAIPGELRDEEIGYSSYGLGWQINTYRNHLLISHGGGIDGFSALVSLLPQKKLGVVALSAKPSPAPYIVASHILDRQLELEPIPWHDRIKSQVDKTKEEEKKSKTEKPADWVEGTQPSHPLSAYAGRYEHPAYGTMTVSLKDETLHVDYNGTTAYTGEHYHYDVFALIDSVWRHKRSAQFQTGLNGAIETLSISLEDAVPPIPFTRVPESSDIPTA